MVPSRLSTQSRFSTNQNDITVTDYEAPPLQTTEIIECLQELGLEISQNDLSHPTKDRMCLLYTVLLQLLFVEDDTQETNDQQDHDDIGNGQKLSGTGTDMTKELVSEMMLFDKMKLFLTRLGAPDFRFTDFTHPTSLRVAKILSVIINYVKSCDASWQEYETEAGQEERQLLETQKQQDEIHELMHKNNETRHKLDNFAPRPDILEANLEQLEQSLQLLEQTSKRKADDLAHLKLTRHNLKDKLDSREHETLALVEKENALRWRAEIDYRKLLSNIKNAENKLEHYEAAITTEKQQLEALTQTKNCQSVGYDFITKAYDLKKEMIQDWKDMDKLNTNINYIKDKIHDIDLKLNKLANDKMIIQTKTKDIDTAHTELHAQRIKKREMISIHMAKLQDDHQKTVQEVAERKRRTQECLEMTHRMALEAQTIQDDYSKYVSKRSSELQRLMDSVTSYNDRMDALLSG